MSDQAQPQRSLASSSIIVLSGKLTANLGSFVGVSIVARALGPSGRGSVAFVTVCALLLASIASLGIGAAAKVFIPRRSDVKGSLYTNGVLFVSCTSLAFGSVAVGIMLLFDSEPAGITPALLLVCIPAAAYLALFDFGLSCLLAVGRPIEYATTLAIAPWLYPIFLGIAAVFTTLDVTVTLVVWLAATAVSGVLVVVVSGRAVGTGPPSRDLLAEVVPFGFRAWLGGLAGSLNFRLDQVIMGFLATTATLGLYAVAVNVSEVVLYVPAVVGEVLVPYVARTDADARVGAVARVFRLSLLVTLGVTAVGAVIGYLLIPAWFGSAFAGSVTPFLLLLPGALGFVAMRLFSNALLGSSKPGYSSLGPVIALIVGVVLDFALIPPYGATGAAIAASGALLVGGLAAVIVYYLPGRVAVREILPGRSDLVDLVLIARRFAQRAA